MAREGVARAAWQVASSWLDGWTAPWDLIGAGGGGPGGGGGGGGGGPGEECITCGIETVTGDSVEVVLVLF